MSAFALLLLLTTPVAAQTPLHRQIAEIAKDAKGTVYVACSLPGTKLDCGLKEHGHPPMQSTFKFPLAMAVLHQIELGKLQLDQPIRFLKSDRSVTYSPLQDEFPEADVDVPLRNLIKLSVETSDNTATDMQLRLIGGPTVLQQYLDSLGCTAIHQQDSEHTLHGDQKLQYRDYAEPPPWSLYSACSPTIRRSTPSTPHCSTPGCSKLPVALSASRGCSPPARPLPIRPALPAKSSA